VKVLILKPGRDTLDYAYMTNGQNCPTLSARVYDSQEAESDQEALDAALQRIRRELSDTKSINEPEAIAVRVLFGGPDFHKPAVVTPEVIQKLESLIPYAPLHLPLVLALLRGCSEIFPGVPVVLVFETAFFAGLPAREYLYGLNADFLKTTGIRRYGFHGIFHKAAFRYISRRRKKKDLDRPARVLSICLEPQPEVAAVIGSRPLMVTSGVTPLEGIPGQTTSGEIDPTIVLTLLQRLGWGPEQINTLLTRDSGLSALAGERVALDSVLLSGQEKHQLARELLQYRFLLACGAGIAAMGGLDALVFSGRFAAAGKVLGPWLVSKLNCAIQPEENNVSCDCLYESLDRIIADTTSADVLATALPVRA